MLQQRNYFAGSQQSNKITINKHRSERKGEVKRSITYADP